MGHLARMQILPLPFTIYDFMTYDPEKTRLLESEAEAEEPTNHNS